MICVSIGRGRMQQMIAEHKLLVEQGAKLVELRIDYLDRHPDVAQIVRDRPGPAIVTIRREQDGGRFRGTEAERLQLLRQAIVAGVEYVDLEDDVAGSIPRYGSTKRIVSVHDFRRTPADLQVIHARLAALDADIVKIATLAQTPHDNVRMLSLIQSSPVPMAGLCMGDIGAASRILAGRFGSPFSYATFSSERQLAPGQLSFRDMRDIYRYEQITKATEVYGVIGDPIQHTLSPLIHNAAFAHLGLDKVYVPFRVPRPNLAEFLADAPSMGLRGLSVTIPHKEGVLAALSEVDPEVEGAGAANTLIFENGKIRGYNTDLQAALESLEDSLRLPGQPKEKSAVEGKTVLVMGAGGAAKAIAFGLVRRGAEVVITSRSPERTAALAQRLKCRSVDWAIRANVKCTVVVNCTPVGMHPNVNESPLEKHQLKPAMTVFDTVYNPESTLLLKHARAQGCKVVTGIEMFVRQAALQFKLFTGQEAPEELMREVIRRAIAPVKATEASAGTSAPSRPTIKAEEDLPSD